MRDSGRIDLISVTMLRQIPVEGGDVLHAMRVDDAGFSGFGEAYFSWIEEKAVKAWKLHQCMVLNLVVPVGDVRFVFFSSGTTPAFREECIGVSRYARITVPPGIWFGFQGLSAPASLVLNLADIVHAPSEVVRKDINDIAFEWKNPSP